MVLLFLVLNIWQLGRAPARPGLVQAAAVVTSPVSSTTPRAPVLIAVPDLPETTSYPVLAVRPTVTTRPSGATWPATSALPAVTGPLALRLWTDAEIPVQPATAQWDQQIYRWVAPDTTAGWHTNTADCGGGVTVIGGHIFYNGRAGVFHVLATITPEQQVLCVDASGVARTFRPVDYLVSDSHTPPRAWYPDWEPALILYTCTPELNRDLIVVRFEEVH